MSVSVVADKCQLDGQGNSAVMVLESDGGTPQEQIAELQHANTRHQATREAAKMYGLNSPATSGMTNHPYAVDDVGQTYEEWQAANPEAPKSEFVPIKYRIDVPVSRSMR